MARAQSSAQRGFLLPGPGLFKFQFGFAGRGWGQGYWDGGAPLDGQPLDDFLQQFVAGITGLDFDLVRPRFQEEPPNLPPANVDWAAVGVTDHDPDAGWAYEFHDGAHDGRTYLQQHETFTMLTSFYGPNADRYDGRLRDGMQLPQNHELMLLTAMGLVAIGTGLVVPRQVNQLWRRRVDRRVRIHRMIREVYPVLNVLSVPISVKAETPADEVLTTTRTVVAP